MKRASKTKIKTGRRGRDMVSPRGKKKTPQQQWSTIGKGYKGMDLLPEERGIWAPHQVPQPLSLAQERYAPKTPGIVHQTDREYAQKNYRTAGNGKSALKNLVHRLTQPENQHKNIRLNSAWTVGEGYTLTLKQLPEREESVGMLPKDWDTGRHNFCTFRLPCQRQCWWVPFWNSPSNPASNGYTLMRVTPIPQLCPGLTAGQGMPHQQAWSSHNRKAYAAYNGDTPWVPGSGGQVGLCFWIPQDIPYIRPLSWLGEVADIPNT